MTIESSRSQFSQALGLGELLQGGELKFKSREELAEYVNHGNSVKYVFFWGHKKSASGVSKSCFSQWYEVRFECNGIQFMTAEHYMMYRKALLFGDSDAAQRVLNASNPGEAKAIGREVKGFDQEKWEACRFEIVVSGNLAKFSYHPELKEFLLNTGSRVLVEASPVDRIWGIGLEKGDSACENPNLWKGSNLLGFALMEVRDQLSR
ncbi:MAG: NADAR family protein [Halopseudomonas sp.]|uniref:NADAR family protein n=1 Tax=Halopseudomonas sp. TaxID=2901191 RepID=UPI003001C5F8